MWCFFFYLIVDRIMLTTLHQAVSIYTFANGRKKWLVSAYREVVIDRRSYIFNFWTPTLSFETSMLMFVDSLSKRLWRVPVKRCEHCTQSVLHSLVLSVLLCLLLILYILNLLSRKEFCLHSVLRYNNNNNINHNNAGFVSQPSRLQKAKTRLGT